MADAVWDERRLRIATHAAGVALWSWNVDSDQIAMDERAFELWGLPPRDRITFEELSARIHPADLDKVRAAFNSTRDLTGAYETDFRILHGSDVRWVSARGRGDDQGIVGRIMFGVFLDVTVRKLAEEAREMITGEMQHRIKNLFSLTSALTSIAARATETKKELADDLMKRLAALSAAHNLIHPGFSEQKRAVTLPDLLAVLLKAYAEAGAHSQSVSISAPEVLVGEHSITALAMIVHELATNSAKYGALSAAGGRLDVACTEDENEVELVWTERGGPAPKASADPDGFGNKLTARVVEQIGGSISRDWSNEGVVVTLRMSKARLGA
jgi:two-component sensor histidine kinase